MSLDQVFSSQEPDSTLEQVERVLQSTVGDKTLLTYPAGLTEREVEVLRLIAAGLSNREIADQLVLALSTVKSYVNTIYGKLQVESRTQAVARARALHLLSE